MIIHISVLQIRRQTLMWRGEEEEWGSESAFDVLPWGLGVGVHLPGERLLGIQFEIVPEGLLCLKPWKWMQDFRESRRGKCLKVGRPSALVVNLLSIYQRCPLQVKASTTMTRVMLWALRTLSGIG